MLRPNETLDFLAAALVIGCVGSRFIFVISVLFMIDRRAFFEFFGEEPLSDVRFSILNPTRIQIY